MAEGRLDPSPVATTTTTTMTKAGEDGLKETDDDLEERKYVFKMKLNYCNIYLVTTSYRKERLLPIFNFASFFAVVVAPIIVRQQRVSLLSGRKGSKGTEVAAGKRWDCYVYRFLMLCHCCCSSAVIFHRKKGVVVRERG